MNVQHFALNHDLIIGFISKNAEKGGELKKENSKIKTENIKIQIKSNL